MSITQRRAGRNIWQRTISRSTQYAEMIDVRSKLDVFNNSKVVKAAFSDEQAEKETIEKEASERIIEHQKLTKAHRDSAMRRGSLPVPARPNTAGPTTATTTTTTTTTGGTMLGESIQVYEASADMGYTHNDRQGRPSTAVSPPPGHMLPKTRRPGTSPSREQWTEDTSVSDSHTHSSRPQPFSQTAPIFHGARVRPYSSTASSPTALHAATLSTTTSRAALPTGIHTDASGAGKRLKKHEHRQFPHLRKKGGTTVRGVQGTLQGGHVAHHQGFTRPSTAPDGKTTQRRKTLLLVEDDNVGGLDTFNSSADFGGSMSSGLNSLNTLQRSRKMALFAHLKNTDTDVNLTPTQKKAMREQMMVAKRQSMMNRRGARGEVSEAKVTEHNRRIAWLRFVAFQQSASLWKTKFEDAMEKKRYLIKIKDAAVAVQRAWNRFYAPIKKRKKEGVQMALVKFSFRLLSRLARIRKRLAKKKVLRFYADFSRQRFAYVMVKFRFNCVKLQRRIRSFYACSQARILVLSMYWNKIEKDVKEKVEQRLADGDKKSNVLGGKWKVKLVGNRFPALATSINNVTEDCVNLQKTIQKGINTVAMTMPKVMGKVNDVPREYGGGGRRHTVAALKEINRESVVPEGVKLDAIKNYLTGRRTVHGDKAWITTRGGNVTAKELDIEAAGQILRGEKELDDHMDYEINKIAWPTFMMLTDEEGRELFEEMVERNVQHSIEKKNAEIQRLVKERLRKELEGSATCGDAKNLPGGFRWAKSANSNSVGSGAQRTYGGKGSTYGGGQGHNEVKAKINEARKSVLKVQIVDPMELPQLKT